MGWKKMVSHYRGNIMVRKILFTLFASTLLSPAQAQETNQTPLVYIIPIRKMIEPALLYVVRRGVDEAARDNADAIILHMNSTGGRVDSAVIPGFKYSRRRRFADRGE